MQLHAKSISLRHYLSGFNEMINLFQKVRGIQQRMRRGSAKRLPCGQKVLPIFSGREIKVGAKDLIHARHIWNIATNVRVLFSPKFLATLKAVLLPLLCGSRSQRLTELCFAEWTQHELTFYLWRGFKTLLCRGDVDTKRACMCIRPTDW